MLEDLHWSRLRIDASEQPDEDTREKRAEFFASILALEKRKYAKEWENTLETFVYAPLRMLPILAAFPVGMYVHTAGTHQIYHGSLRTTLLVFGLFCFLALWIFITLMSQATWGQQGRTNRRGAAPIISYALIGLALLGFYTLGAFSGDIVTLILK